MSETFSPVDAVLEQALREVKEPRNTGRSWKFRFKNKKGVWMDSRAFYMEVEARRFRNAMLVQKALRYLTGDAAYAAKRADEYHMGKHRRYTIDSWLAYCKDNRN